MPDKTIFVVQVFERSDGELVAGDREVTTWSKADARARQLARKAAGAVVIKLHDAEGTGALTATYLAAFGDVPEPYVEVRVEEPSIGGRDPL